MVLSFDHLQALRDCCRDDAAFARLQELLQADRDQQTAKSAIAPTASSTDLALPPEASIAAPPSPPSELLRGVAVATSHLLTSDDYTQAIDAALATVGQVTRVDRVYIFAIHPHPETGELAASQKFEWVRASVTPQLHNPALQNRIYATSGLMRWYTLLHTGQPLSCVVRHLPLMEQAVLSLQDIQSVLMVPILMGGKLWGLLGLDDCHTERAWSQDETAALQLMASSIGGAIARQRTEVALGQSEARLQRITAERKQVEDAYRRSEARYRAMLDASPDMMFRLSIHGKYLDFNVNDEADLVHEVIVGQYLHDLLPADVAALALTTIRKTLETGERQTCEYQLLMATGWRDYEARLVVSGHDEVLAIVQDVTERKQVEAELRASEARLQGFFNATFEAVVIHDFGKILDVNPAAERLFGYRIADMIGMPVLHLVSPASRETVLHQWRSLTSPQQPYEYEAVGIRQDGSTFIGVVAAKAIQFRGQVVRVAGVRDITASKQAEETLRQSEARNRAMVNGIPDLIFRIRRDGMYLDCKAEQDSDALLPPHEIIGKSLYDVLPPDLAQQRMDFVNRALETGEIQRFEYQLRLNGQNRASQIYRQISPNLASAAPEQGSLHDYEARIVVSGDDEVLAIVRDISDRKRSEAALRLSEEKFSKAFRASPNPMTIATLLDGRLIEVNDSYTKIFGYSRHESLGRTAHALHLWVNRADRDAVVQQLQQHGSVRSLEFSFQTQSGELRTGLFSADVIQIGAELCLIDSVTDITERKRAEQQIWTAAERDRLLGEIALRIRQSLDLEQIFNTTVAEIRQFLNVDRVFIGHFTPGEGGRIVAESRNSQVRSVTDWVMDRAAYQELKAVYEQGTYIVNDTSQGLVAPFARKAYDHYETRAALGVPILLEGCLFGALVAHQCTAPRQWEASAVSLMEGLATQVAIAVQQAQLYRQVQDLNTGLEQQVAERTAQLQQKMEELQELNDLKDEFLNAFSHDLKTPIMGISLVLSNLLNQPGDPIPVTRSILERMVQSSNHQLHLINSLLQAHSSEMRGVTLHYELVQLSLLTQRIVEDLEPLVLKNQATLANRVPPDLPPVNADPVQLRRVFENLITNALNHNPPGVHLILHATVEKELIRVTLQDDGVGISPEVSQHLFERYMRGPKSRHSTGIGLGLYLCRQIITAHGGQIGVHSTPNIGSTFWLTLPLAIPAVTHPDPAADSP